MRKLALLSFLFILFGCSSLKKEAKPISQNSNQKWTVKQAREHIALSKLRLKNNKAKKFADFIYQDYFLKGNSAYLSSEYELGNVYFSELAQVFPEDSYIKQKYAVGLIRSGQFKESKRYLKEIFDSNPKKQIKVGLVLGGVLSGLGESGAARALYQRILKLSPKEHDACLFLAKSYLSDKDSPKAIKTLRKCERRNPKSAVYPYYLGKIYLNGDQTDKAMALFKKAYDLNSSYSEALSSYTLLLEKKKKNKLAIKFLKKHLKKHEEDRLILTSLVEKLFYYERFGEVLPYAEKLSDLSPEDLNLKVKLGILYSDAKKYDLAITTFNEILVQVPDSDKVLYYLAAIYQEVDELDKSIETYTKIKNESSLYQESLFQVATILERFALEELKEDGSSGKQGEEFVSFIQKHFEQEKDLQVRFAVQLAGYFEGQKQYKSAEQWLKKVLSHQKMTQNHLFYYASLLEKQKNFQEAYAVVNGILAKEPKNAHAFNFLGYSLLERGIEADKAHAYIMKAHKISPDDGYILDSMGWYHYKNGDYAKAHGFLKKAFEQVPTDTTIAKHLVLSYMKLYREEKVEKFLSQLFDQSPGLFEAPEFIEILKKHSLKHRFPASAKENP